MKKIILLITCILCLTSAATAESPSLEDRIAALEARIATLEELLNFLTATPAQGTDYVVPEFIPGQNDPQYAEDSIWYHDAEQGIILECTDFYYNDTNRGEILWKFTVRNGSENKVRFSAQNVYINGWLHSTAISSASMDELAPHSNSKDFIMLTGLLSGSIDGIETLEDIGRVKEIRFELVVRINGRETERIPVTITDFSTLEEREGW